MPWPVKALALAVAAYAVSPIDLIPDSIPVLGYLDDVILVPLGIALVVRLIPAEIIAEHRAAAATARDEPVSWTAGTIIVVIWVSAISLSAWLAYKFFWPVI